MDYLKEQIREIFSLFIHKTMNERIKNNPNHAPAGTSIGGQFTSGPSPTKVGQKVKYRKPVDPGDKDMTFTVVEIDVAQDWALIRANVNMNIKPTYTANVSDLVVINN